MEKSHYLEKTVIRPRRTVTQRGFAPDDFDEPSTIVRLHQSLGNQAVQAILRSGALRAKLSISRADDPLELEADRVADQVMKMREPSLSSSNVEPDVNRKNITDTRGTDTGEISADNEAELEQGIQSIKAGGKPLTDSEKTFFEPRFGMNLSAVRVHDDSAAAKIAEGISAKAFAVGNDIAFSTGAHETGSDEGKRLMAHELAHVVQNSSVVFKTAMGVQKADAALPSSPPPLTTADIELTYGPNADSAVVSAKTISVIKDILVAANEKTAIISSTQRDSTAQARAMYINLESEGVEAQKALYGSNGDLVIDEYEKLKGEGKTSDQIKAGMKVKIDALGPSTVSKHCGDPAIVGVIDIEPISIEHKAQFETAAEAAHTSGKVSKFLKPPSDPAYHLEIPQV